MNRIGTRASDASGFIAHTIISLVAVSRTSGLEMIQIDAAIAALSGKQSELTHELLNHAAAASETADATLDDDMLRLIFTCCHPALSGPAQMALALRTLCGLSTREIARAFLEPEATTAQRLVRARK